MVDQLRQPMWLDSAQTATYNATIIPKIFSIASQAYVFPQFYCNSTPCMPSRACFLTGLYPQQQSIFVNAEEDPTYVLNNSFPTFAEVLAAVKPSYSGRSWWFGKWHLSKTVNTLNPLAQYGFQTGLYPGALNPSPNGWPNEGINGQLFNHPPDPLSGQYFAKDIDIVDDFSNWIDQHSADSNPWCTTVSLVNPHDISFFPDWFFQPSYDMRVANSLQDAHFPPTGFTPVSLFTGAPNPWNFEDVASSGLNKPLTQLTFRQQISTYEGGFTTPSQWIDLLNYYYTLQQQVDLQVGRVLTKLDQYPAIKAKTIIVFTSDHGEYCGSHSLRTKGGAVYDETMRVPLYVKYPGQTTSQKRYQMCSSVDFVRLIAELGSNGVVPWGTIPNLSYLDTRESIFKFIQSATQAEEKRLVTLGTLTTPYILHTYDNDRANSAGGQFPTYQAAAPGSRSHIVCMRTKTDLDPNSPINTPATNYGYNGAKYSVYSQWASCTARPQSEAEGDVDHEFYDYGNSLRNRKELGNDYQTTDATSGVLRDNMKAALGTFTTAGKIQSELLPPLPSWLLAVQQQARQVYLNYVSGGTCV